MKKLCLFILVFASLMMLTNCTNHTHAYGEWKTIKEVGCTSDGISERVCECGEKETKNIAAISHSAIPDESEFRQIEIDSITYDAYICKNCSIHLVVIDGVATHIHSYNDTVVIKASGCTEQGICNHICECGEEKNGTIPATGHSEAPDQSECTPVDGDGVILYTYKCSGCGLEMVGYVEEKDNNNSDSTTPLSVPQDTEAIVLNPKEQF